MCSRNKGADQLCSYCTVDLCVCFLWFSYVVAQIICLPQLNMSHSMGKPTIYIGKIKGADQLRSN